LIREYGRRFREFGRQGGLIGVKGYNPSHALADATADAAAKTLGE
jgi:hypothetical protein